MSAEMGTTPQALEVPPPQVQWPFSERNGSTADADIAILTTPIETPLTAEDLSAAQTFAHGLYEGRLGELNADSPHNLEAIRNMTTTESIQPFYLDYFKTKAGQEDLARLGFLPDAPMSIVTTALRDVRHINQIVTEKTRKDISSRSLKWYKEQVGKEVSTPRDAEAAYKEYPVVEVNYEPHKLLDKFEDLQAYRRFYREVWRSIKESDDSPLFHAQRTLLEVHIRRVNSLITEHLYPDMCKLAQQLDHSTPNTWVDHWTYRLQNMAPIIMRAYGEQYDRPEHEAVAYHDDLNRRLDLVRNGAAAGEGHNYVSISPELTALEAKITTSTAPEADPAAIQFTPDELAVMDKTRWKAVDLQNFNQDMLQEWGLLSEHQATWEEVEARNGPAADGKWQIVISPKRESLSIDGAKRVMWVPESFDRTLTQASPAGVLPLSAHELTHVWQNNYDLVLAQQVPLAEVKGARYVTVREMGGIEQERIVQASFGRARRTELHYLRAMQVKAAGGSRGQVAQAFYDSLTKGKTLDAAAALKAGKTAADRMTRFYRMFDHNSQPLDYIEQDAMEAAIHHLSLERQLAIILAGGSFAWSDAAKLHRAGLFEIPESVSVDPAQEVIRVFRQRYLPALLGVS